MFRIVPELTIAMAPSVACAVTPLAPPSTTPAITSIVVVPRPTLLVWIPLPLTALTSAVVVTEMAPTSALNARMPSRDVAPDTVIGPFDVTETGAVAEVEGENAIAAGRVDRAIVDDADRPVDIRVRRQRRASKKAA